MSVITLSFHASLSSWKKLHVDVEEIGETKLLGNFLETVVQYTCKSPFKLPAPIGGSGGIFFPSDLASTNDE
jgi:hypothetical protein